MRKLDSTNKSRSHVRFLNRELWSLTAYKQNGGVGEKSIKDFHFRERLHYGVVDRNNNSIIPNEDFLVQVGTGRMFDFEADSYSLMKLNCLSAINQGNIPQSGIFENGLNLLTSYSNPRKKYGRYLENIFQHFNNSHIPSILDNNIITSHEDYVKKFFNFFLNQEITNILTMTKWNTTNRSSILDTGLAFTFMDLPYDADQRKLDEIIDKPEFEYFKNLTMNMGFSINHSNPNILVYDLASPAGESIRNSYALFNLDSIFNSRFIKTHTIDNDILYNTINIYYNKYVNKKPLSRQVSVQCGKTTSSYTSLTKVPLSTRVFSNREEIHLYCKIRNFEEGSPFSESKVKSIVKKANYLEKKLDKASAIGYINDMFKDQLWNKFNGFHDFKAKLEGQTTTNIEVQTSRATTARTGRSSY